MNKLISRVKIWPVVALVVIAVGLVVLGFAIRMPAALDRFESSLLDWRLRVRSNYLKPSSDIVVIGMDKRTLDYARNHPELGIDGYVLPRRHLADVIGYLSEDKAKAIVLDLEFRTPQTEQDDAALERALRMAGNVHLGSSAELPLTEFSGRQNARRSAEVRQDLHNAFYYFQLLPYIIQQAQNTRFVSGSCAPTYFQSGFEGLFSVPQALSMPRENFLLPWHAACRQAGLSSAVTALSDAQPERNESIPFNHTAPASDILMRLSREQCLLHLYYQSFQRHPGFLDVLARKHLALNEAPDLPDSVKDQVSICQINPTLERFLSSAKGLGLTTVSYDQDVMLRQIPLVYRGFQGRYFSYLGLQPLMDTGFRAENIELGPESLKIHDKLIPFFEKSDVIINWRNPALLVQEQAKKQGYSLSETEVAGIDPDKGNRLLGYGHLYRMVSPVDILLSEKARARGDDVYTPSLYNRYGDPGSGRLSFRNKIVIYGDAVKDIHPTPVSSRTYGPEIIATVVDMLMNDQKFVQKAPAWVIVLITLLVSVLLIFSQIVPRRLYLGLGIGLALLVLYWVYDIIVFIHSAYMIPLVGPTLIFMLSLASGILYRYYIHDREKRQLASVFSHYVSPQVMEQILADTDKSLENLAGVEKNLTVLFADLAGFTERFATEEDPRRMVKQLNEFFTAMTRIILKHQGTYDKYIGDAIMAFFGSPVEFPDHAAKACEAALEMQEELRRLNEKWREQGIPSLSLGIGLSTGTMIVGNFGSDMLHNFTVMGSSVNLGARLEALTRKVGAPILISEATMQEASARIVARDLGQHPVKGFSEPVSVYALENLKKT